MYKIGNLTGPRKSCRLIRIVGYAGVGYTGFYCSNLHDVQARLQALDSLFCGFIFSHVFGYVFFNKLPHCSFILLHIAINLDC